MGSISVILVLCLCVAFVLGEIGSRSNSTNFIFMNKIADEKLEKLLSWSLEHGATIQSLSVEKDPILGFKAVAKKKLRVGVCFQINGSPDL